MAPRSEFSSTIRMSRNWVSVSVFVFLMVWSQEAWVSGSAGISVLEEGVFYSYEEHGRKILEADEYQDYFARKRKAMLGAIVYAIPEFRAWKKAVAAAGLKIEDAPIFRTEENAPRLSVIVLEGSRGTKPSEPTRRGAQLVGYVDSNFSEWASVCNRRREIRRTA